MSALNPNVTIKFSGEGDQAIKASNAVGAALDDLAIKSRNAKAGLQAVSLMMDNVSNKSAKVTALGAAYQSAASGIVSTLNATRASAAAFANMGAAADAAKAKVVSLNQENSASPKNGRQASLKSAPGSAAPSSITDVGPSIVGLGRMAATTVGVSIGLAAVGQQMKALITANMDLDAAMSSVAAVGNLDKMSAQYRELTALVVDLGGKTQYSASQAADGLKELIAGGYSAAEAGSALKDTLNLAATENMAMSRASEIVVSGLSAFRLQAKDSTRLVDVLAKASNASTASVDGMGEAFKYLAPTAAAMNVSLEDSAAVIALLGKYGIQGGLAGRGASAMMARMVAPAKDAQAVLAKFGVTLAEINPEIAGIGPAMKTLEKIDTSGLVTLFGSENLDVSNVIKANVVEFANMQKEINAVGVSADSVATKKNDNAGGDFKKLSAAIQEVRAELGKDLYAAMRVYVQDFTTYLRENKDEIIATVKHVADLAVALLPVAKAYLAVKAVGMVKTLAGSIVKWGLETTAITANTNALVANASAGTAASARGPKGAALGNGAVVGAVVGYSLAPEDAGTATKVGFTAGGAVGGAVVAGVSSVIAQAIGPAVATAMTSAGGAITAAGTALVGTVAAAITFPVVAIGAGAAYVAYEFNELKKSQIDAADATMAAGEAYVGYANRALAAVKSDEDLAKAKANISRVIVGLKGSIADAEANGASAKDTEYDRTSLAILQQKLGAADRIHERNQKIAESAKLEADALAKADVEAKKIAADLQIAKVHAENLANAGEKMAESLPDFGKLIIESLPDPESLNIFKAQEAQAVSAANAARAAIEASLSKAGVDTSLISKDRTIKDTDDVVAYARAAFALLKNNDKNGNLLGTDAAAALKKAVEDSLAAKKAAEGKDSAIQTKEAARVKTSQEIASIESEIAINRAKAAGNTAEVKKLEREKAMMEEKVKLQALLTKDIPKGKEGDADRKIAIAKADSLAEQSVNAKLASEKQPGGPVVTLGSAAQGINSFFGRSANAGMIEEAKKHTELLAAIKDVLSKTTKPEKTEIVVRPAFGGGY